jgi:hypothetical protein
LRQLKVKDYLAGKHVLCPQCKARLLVPEAEIPELDVAIEEDAPPPKPKKRQPDEAITANPGKRPRKDVESYGMEAEDKERVRRRQRQKEVDEEIKRLRSKYKNSIHSKPPRQQDSAREHGGFLGWAFYGGLVGGGTAMLIAVVWFVLGIILLDRIFFYPPILFIVGIAGVFRGLTGGEE